MACYSKDVVERRSEQVLDAIVAFKREHNGNSPSLRELIEATDLTSTSIVSYYLDKLEAAGKISRGEYSEFRNIEVANSEWVYHETNQDR
jgi:predicted MarR family transcription regulator